MTRRQRRPPPAPRDPIRVRSTIDWRRVRWFVLSVGVLVATFWIAAQVPVVTVPVLLALALAYALEPAVRRLEQLGLGRGLAALLLLVGLGLVGAGLGFVVAPQIVEEFARLPAKLAELYERVEPWVERTFGVPMPDDLGAVIARAREALAADGAPLERLRQRPGWIVGLISGSTAGVIAILAGLTVIPILTFYLLRGWDRVLATARELIPPARRGPVIDAFRRVDAAMSGFVRGQLIVALILAALYSIGFVLVGLPLPLVVGIVSGLGNLVPYLGTAIGLVLATILGVLEGGPLTRLLLVYAVFVAVQMLEAYLITPQIVGTKVGLSPIAVIVAILVFGELFGLYGMLIAVPVTAILKIVLGIALDYYRRSELYRQG